MNQHKSDKLFNKNQYDIDGQSTDHKLPFYLAKGSTFDEVDHENYAPSVSKTWNQCLLNMIA